MAVIKLMYNIIENLEKGQFSATIFLDFSKAFDTVNHEILLRKLEHYGVRGVANNWIKSYLHERKQFCTINNTKSRETFVRCGVPQGSIIGPLLFLLYIDDLGTTLKNMKPILFADDSNLIISGNSLDTIETKIRSEIPILLNWLQTNRLSLNIKKTHIMIFGPTRKKHPLNINISIEGEKLEIVRNTKFLGIILDDQLLESPHHISIPKNSKVSGDSLQSQATTKFYYP
jgi:ribonuclease P/MRP protein subunit RPP40